MAKSRFHIDPAKLQKVLRTQPAYRDYSFRVATQIKTVAITTFQSRQNKSNEQRLSNTTPPKYISSFRIEWHLTKASHRVVNDDPGWHWVEYGSHPGGDPDTFILRYRPLGVALDVVAAGGG